jgi:hypothetical protein
VLEVDPRGSGYPLLGGGDNEASTTLARVLSRASMKNCPGAAPLFVIVTGMFTATPADRQAVHKGGSASAFRALPPFDLRLMSLINEYEHRPGCKSVRNNLQEAGPPFLVGR